MLFVAAAAAASGADPGTNLISNPQFRAGAEGWLSWAPRPEIAAASELADTPEGKALRMSGGRSAAFGKWITVVGGIRPGRYYRFEILRQTQGVSDEELSTGVILSWCGDEEGKTPVQRDYVDKIAEAGEWRREQRTLRAPDGARAVRVELFLRWTAGSVLWKEPRLAEVDPPKRRIVRVATTHLMPGSPNTVESNTRAIRETIDRAGREKPDIILLSENLVDRSVDLPLVRRAQPIPGPFTAMLAEQARKYRAYVVTTLQELDQGLVYNTAVLMDREGRLAGKYRKVHLPLSEAEDGITPGSGYAVFDTDFGRIGLLTCWDNWFVEPARILRLKGAEMLLFPIAGDGVAGHWDVVSRARAIDNGVYLVSANTNGDTASRIVDPSGAVLGEAAGDAAVVVREIDLDKEWRTRWLSVGPAEGEGKSLYIKERRPDTYGVLLEDAHQR